MKKYFILIFLSTIPMISSAQKLANNWYFGNYIGLNFDSAKVRQIPSALSSIEGCAAISDSAGRTMLYSNGETVWNGNNQVIIDGEVPNGNQTGSQQLLLKKTGSDSLYYLIHHNGDIAGSQLTLRYSIISKKNSEDPGKVIVANRLINYNMQEKFSATSHRNGRDIWLGTKTMDDKISIYKITDQGLDTIPLEFQQPQLPVSGIQFFRGNLKFSANGNQIAVTTHTKYCVEVFDFDNQNGIVGNRRLLVFKYFGIDEWLAPLGCDFSCDGKLLYVIFGSGAANMWGCPGSDGNPSYGIVTKQFDLSYQDGDTMRKYAYDVFSDPISLNHSLQLGPDGSIYSVTDSCYKISGYFFKKSYLSRILNPNVKGAGCNFQKNVLQLPSNTETGLLPNFCSTYLRSKPNFAFDSKCKSLSKKFLYTGSLQMDSLKWFFGDPVSGLQNTSKEINPTHIFSQDAVYQVSLITYSCFGADTVTKFVQAKSVPFGLPDSSACIGDSVQILKNQPNYVFSINNDTISSQSSFSQPGTYFMTVDLGGCSIQDTFSLFFHPRPVFSLGKDSTVCSNSFPIQIGFSDLQGFNFKWNNGKTTPFQDVKLPGLYILRLFKGSCFYQDSIKIASAISPVVSLGPDVSICQDRSIELSPNQNFTTYLWNTSDTSRKIKPTMSGLYWIKVSSQNGCSDSDTMNLNFLLPPRLPFFGSDTLVCNSFKLDLSAPVSIDSCRWNNGSNATERLIQSNELVWLKAYKNGCPSIDSISVRFSSNPKIPEYVLKDSIFCLGDTIQIVLDKKDWEFQWNGIFSENKYSFTEPQRVQLVVQNLCGTDQKEGNFLLENCDLFIPNLVTVNNDGKNETFEIPNLGRYPNNLEIFNRWGKSVFRTSDYMGNWPKNDLESGVYFYHLSVQHPKRGGSFKGWIEVIK